MATPSSSTLILYKHLLRSLQSYPTKNRSGLIASVRLEFRDNVEPTEDTPRLIKEAWANLNNIRQYTGLGGGDSHWKIDLEQVRLFFFLLAC